MKPEEVALHYPRLYHMAQANSWESIKKHGLLSTSALLDLFEVRAPQRFKIESCHRPECIPVTHPVHGDAVVRDQKPMSEGALDKCLDGMTPMEWYGLLNGMVFFWPTEERLARLLSARAYRSKMHCIVILDTTELLDRYLDRLYLSPINSGSTLFNPRTRGPGTFLRISEYPFEDRKRTRGAANAIAEVAAEYAVPDIGDLAIRVEHRQGDRIVAVLHERS